MKTARYVLVCTICINLLPTYSAGAQKQEKNAQGEVVKQVSTNDKPATPPSRKRPRWQREVPAPQRFGNWPQGADDDSSDEDGGWWPSTWRRRIAPGREPLPALRPIRYAPVVEAPIPAPLDGGTRIGMPNLGATCYLNSFFKYATYNRLFEGVLDTELVRQPGESERLFAARRAVQQSLGRVLRYLQKKDGLAKGQSLPVPFVKNFIGAWNRMYLAEQDSSNKVTGVQFTLLGFRQEDTAYVIRVLHNALAYPKVLVTETLTAVDDATNLPLPHLTIKAKDVALPGSIDLTLGMHDRDDAVSMQELVLAAFGEAATDYVGGLRTWQQLGESPDAQTAQKAMYLKPGTVAVTFIINDRIYPDYSKPTAAGFYNKKNQARLEVNPIIEIATMGSDGKAGSQKMRLRGVVGHSGGAYGGHYKMLSYERDADGHDYWVTHDDGRISLGADMAGMERGARCLHYELLTE